MSVQRYSFGSGLLFMRPSGGNQPTNSTPVQLGALQDVNVQIATTLKELNGQYQFPDDVAPGSSKLTGKAKVGMFSATMLANAVGQSVAVGRKRIVQEAGAVPGSVSYIITVSHAANFVNDYGVTYNTTGLALTRVTGAPTVGQYSVVETTGVYTFAAADASAAVVINYEYTDAAVGNTVAVLNQLQGFGPVLEMYLSNAYNGDSKDMRLFAVRIGAINRPTKNGDYLITEFDFQAFANAAGQVFEYYEG